MPAFAKPNILTPRGKSFSLRPISIITNTLDKICNASIYFLRPFIDQTKDDIRNIMEINYFKSLNCILNKNIRVEWHFDAYIMVTRTLLLLNLTKCDNSYSLNFTDWRHIDREFFIPIYTQESVQLFLVIGRYRTGSRINRFAGEVQVLTDMAGIQCNQLKGC